MRSSIGTAREAQLYNIGQPTPEDASDEIAAIHWAIRAMRPNHPAFKFMAGVLSYRLEFGASTARQIETAGKVIRQLRAEMYAEFGE